MLQYFTSMPGKLNPQDFKKIFFFLLIFSLGLLFGAKYLPKTGLNLPSFQAEKNTPKAFLSEIYDKIKANYWEKITDEQLIQAFKDAASAINEPISREIKTKDQLLKTINKDKASKIVAQVLASLPPLGRSGLFTQAQELKLSNTVANINPEKNLYNDLGISKGASGAAVAEAYAKKQQELAGNKTPQAQEKLKEISYAKEVLTQDDTKKRYDSGGVEPTIFTKAVGSTLYIQFKKFSPSSLDEFQKAFDKYSTNNLDSFILDLRGNIGGAIDSTANFLGFFIGKNQSAFEFYHQGEYLPFRTPTDKILSINKYKQAVILVDNQTESSAEMMAASFKKYHLGIVLGVPTKGWGTVERVFPLDNQFDQTQKYSLFLVHSITLRDDNLPIEGRGVEPNINLKDADWQSQLFSYFHNSELTTAVNQVLPIH